MTPYPLSDSDRIASLERQLAEETSVPLRSHIQALAAAEVRFQDERDRRYSEGAVLRATALEIKQIADAKALELAAEIQTYKDQQADQLRTVTVNAQGNRTGRDQITTWFFGSGAVGAAIAAVVTYFAIRH